MFKPLLLYQGKRLPLLKRPPLFSKRQKSIARKLPTSEILDLTEDLIPSTFLIRNRWKIPLVLILPHETRFPTKVKIPLQEPRLDIQ
ncbi:hypothetical protein LIER_06716 [Lithospermum erythrorhizon]|uniref:Uncharacterized protein n=1 Tax=Lithospermum erythrorhizon TaxID=34254 RepID=A0AAV3P9V1_LITER